MKKGLVCFVMSGLAVLTAAGNAAYVDPELKLILPAELEGLAYDHSEVYQNPALGYCVFFESGHTSAKVRVYTLGRSDIPEGPEGDGIDLVLESIQSELLGREEDGGIAALRKRGLTILPREGEVRFANLVHQFSEPRVMDGITNGVQRIHAAYVTGWSNRFIRAELTFDLLDRDAGRAAADGMLKLLTARLLAQPSEEDLLLASCDALILDPAGAGGRRAAQRVLAETQKRGNLNVYTHLFAWPDGYMKPDNADLLVTAYFAGMLKVVVPQQLDEGGEYEGFLALLKAYEHMRAKDDIKPIDPLDEWLKADDLRALFDRLLTES